MAEEFDEDGQSTYSTSSNYENIDLENIPNNFRGILFVIVYLLIFGGSIYLLKTLNQMLIIQKLKVVFFL